MPVPYIAILKIFSSVSNSSGWPSSNVNMLMLCVSDIAMAGFLHILTLILLLARSSYSSTLMIRIDRGLLHACTYALSQFSFGQSSWSDVLVLSNGV